MNKMYSICLMVVINNNHQCVTAKQVINNEDDAINEYFKLDKKKSETSFDIQRKVKMPVESYLKVDVTNLDDSSLSVLDKYNFFSKIQEIKDKARLPFVD